MLYLTRNRSCNPAAVNGVDRLFEEMSRGLGLGAPGAVAEFDPKLDVSETEAAWCVRADLPGLEPADVELSVTGNALTLRGEKKAETKAEAESLRRTERRYGKFARTLEFPTDLDGSKVEATAKNGVLTIVLPKAEAARPKTIAIKVVA